MRNADLRELYRPVYFGNIFGVPVPIIVFLVVAAIGAFILYRTSFGRHVVALGSNEDVARYSGVPIWRVRTLTYVIQGICVGIAVLVYVPRLGSATPDDGPAVGIAGDHRGRHRRHGAARAASAASGARSSARSSSNSSPTSWCCRTSSPSFSWARSRAPSSLSPCSCSVVCTAGDETGQSPPDNGQGA